jgi:hypothetical protein
VSEMLQRKCEANEYMARLPRVEGGELETIFGTVRVDQSGKFRVVRTMKNKPIGLVINNKERRYTSAGVEHKTMISAVTYLISIRLAARGISLDEYTEE